MAVGQRNYGASTATSAGRSLEQFKQAFFDREAIIKAMDRATAKALSKFGAFVRQRAKTSIRYRVDPSAPGSPPSGHKTMTRFKTSRKTGVTKKQEVSPLREFIFFAYDKAKKEVIIGPAKTNQKNAEGEGGLPIPAVLEYGGRVRLYEHLVPNKPAIYGRFAGKWIRTDLRLRLSEGGMRSAVGRPRRIRTAMHPARPFMRPAFEAELPQLIQFFKNSL